MKQTGLIILLIFCSLAGVNAQNNSIKNNQEDSVDLFAFLNEQTIEKSFLIVLSTKDAEKANQYSKLVSDTLKIENLSQAFSTDSPTSYLYDSVYCSCGSKHSRIGVSDRRYRDGNYVSIDVSNTYDGFAKDYLIVIAASGAKEDMLDYLVEVHKSFPQAYIKTTKVFMGCTH